jgi:hypothetical protein
MLLSHPDLVTDAAPAAKKSKEDSASDEDSD